MPRTHPTDANGLRLLRHQATHRMPSLAISRGLDPKTIILARSTSRPT